MDTPAESLARWNTPECPFTIEYVPRVLDDIRLSVVDAFFSLPRGGAEIGGILTGHMETGRVVITDAIPVECQHAFGPSFTLSDKDQEQLGAKLGDAARNPDSRPVGWYHSHTRSEIFLSDADLAIHKRFFPEPSQVALVLKPHTFLPTRAGFFFRDQEGSIRAEASYQEFQLDPLPIGKLPAEEPAPHATAMAQAAPLGRVIDMLQAAGPAPVAEPASAIEMTPEAEPEPAPPALDEAPSPMLAPPRFMMEEPAPSRRWIVPVAILAGLAVGAAGFLTRQLWMPRLAGSATAGNTALAMVGLTAVEDNDSLLLRWDNSARHIVNSTGGILLIVDGSEPWGFPLTQAQLQAGSFRYQRKAEHVNITLTLAEPNGEKALQTTAFTGSVPPPYRQPAPAPAPEAAPTAPAPVREVRSAADEMALRELREERDRLRTENASLKAANTQLKEANKRMERYIETDRAEHQRKRMENQSDGK